MINKNGDITSENPDGFSSKHSELWKFIKFSFAGASSSLVEIIVHMILLNFVFASWKNVVIANPVLNFLGIDYKGYMWSFFISTIIGYSIAFIINRKVTFKADSNATLSIVLYAIMVIFTIFANTWIGSVLSSFSVEYNWGNGGDFIIKLIGMAIPTLWTYPLNRFVIHRKKKVSSEDTAQ